MKKIIALVVVGLVVLFVGIVVLMGISYRNDEVGLRNQAIAQEKTNTVIFDKVWKTIQQLAQIADEYKTAFSKIYPEIMDARYAGNDNLLFKFVQEQNPNLSTELYKQLGDVVQANRAEFARVQSRLIDIKREHDNLRQKFPSSLFVGNRPELEIRIVTSTKTEAIFQSGKDDDVNLFKK